MAADAEIRVLFVEDNPADAELAERALRKGGLAVSSLRVESEEELIAALEAHAPDLVISDYSLPAYDGMRALLAARSRNANLPFIILTGALNEETAVECMKAGASDYVLKDHLARLPFAAKEAIETALLRREAERKELELTLSEARYRAIFNDSDVAMLIVDPERFVVIDANGAAERFYGWPHGELLGKPIGSINTLDPAAIKEKMGMALDRRASVFGFTHRKSDGATVDVEVYSGPIVIDGRTCLLSIIHDATQRVIAERQRDEALGKLRHYLSTSPTISYSLRLKDGAARVGWMSENVERILGYSVTEALEPDWWFNHVHSSDRAALASGISDLVSNDSTIGEYRFIRKDRSTVWIRDILRLGQRGIDDGEVEIVGTLIDISQAKGLEDELRLKGAALEAADAAIVITDRSGAVEWVNAAFERLTGYPKAETLGSNLRELLSTGIQDKAYYRSLWDTISAGEVWSGVLVNRRRSGEQYKEEMTITPVLDMSGKIAHFVAIKYDVTDRIRSEDLLKRSLEEREILLREVHHRVKNNMQVISSLINLSTRVVTDAAAKETLENVGRRIRAIATVHEQFYGSEDLKRIDFRRYLEKLVANATEDSGMRSLRPELRVEVDALAMDLEMAIPAGLIVSELLAAAIKELKDRPGRRGELTVGLAKRDVEVSIEVRNDSAELSVDAADPLAWALMDTLSMQLRGSVTVRRDGGLVAVFRFPAG